MIVYEKIEAEELRFIYGLILDGWTDSEILNRYVSLKNHGELDFPRRIDVSFIKDKRNEFEIAAEVLKDGIKKIVNLIRTNGKDEHLSRISDVSAILLQDNLDKIMEVIKGRYIIDHQFSYSPKNTTDDGGRSSPRLDKVQLTEIIRKNVEKACKEHGVSFFFDCYISHLKATTHGDMEVAGGFWPAVEKDPYKVIQQIKTFTESKESIGDCPLCSSESHLPPFIESVYGDMLQN